LFKLYYSKIKVNNLVQHKTLHNMNIIYFQKLENQNNFTIKFNYKNSIYNIDRQFNFNRNINETVSFCLSRIKTNIEKEFIKNSKKQLRKTKNHTQASTFPEVSKIIEIFFYLFIIYFF